MKHVLIVTIPGSEPEQFELKGKRIGLGRGVDNDICIDEKAVSSSHLEFKKVGNGYQLEDQNSTNGTRVNGKVTQVTTLADGDRLLIGETVAVRYLVLAEGETWEAGTAAGSDEDRKVAGEDASMSDRLEKLEANIEAKEEETAKLEAQLVELRANYEKKLAEYEEAQSAVEKLQAEMEEKKGRGDVSDAEIEILEQELIKRTQRVKVMSATLATKKKQISKLEGAAPLIIPKKAAPLEPKIPIRKAGAPGAKTIPVLKAPQNPPPRVIVKKKPNS